MLTPSEEEAGGEGQIRPWPVSGRAEAALSLQGHGHIL